VTKVDSHNPSIIAASDRFELELKEFERQVSEATQFQQAQMTLNHVAGRNQGALRAFNDAPMFWNTVRAALQYASIMAVGRIFDDSRGGPRTVTKLLNEMRAHPEIFSKEALAYRQRKADKSP
jgi:hypothetical protein